MLLYMFHAKESLIEDLGSKKNNMGSLTEEQLIQMVRDFIESESDSVLPTSDSFSRNHKPRCLTTSSQLQEILWETTDAEAEVLQQIFKHAKSVEFDVGDNHHHADSKKLVVMKLKLDGYDASLCKTSWDSTSDSFKVFHFTGHYDYIEVVIGDITPTRLIVDMDFRSQFEMAKPTRAYKELTDTLPCVFVGSEAKLGKIITLLSSAAKESLRERGLHVPPWRKASYMESKWLSKNWKKI